MTQGIFQARASAFLLSESLNDISELNFFFILLLLLLFSSGEVAHGNETRSLIIVHLLLLLLLRLLRTSTILEQELLFRGNMQLAMLSSGELGQ